MSVIIILFVICACMFVHTYIVVQTYCSLYVVSRSHGDRFILFGREKVSGEQPILLFSDPQNLGMLSIGGGLSNKDW